jgi:hypothetical protein
MCQHERMTPEGEQIRDFVHLVTELLYPRQVNNRASRESEKKMGVEG